MTIGNGSVVATYTKIGRLVYLTCKVTLGSTSSVDGAWTFYNLPFATPGNYDTICRGLFQDSSHNWHAAYGTAVSNRVYIRHPDNSLNTAINATVPFTWEENDFIYWEVTYYD